MMSSAVDVVGSTDELLLKILLRLPAKPLARLNLVSKRWKSLIPTHHVCNQPLLGLICPDHRIPFFDFVPLAAPNLVQEPPFRLLRFPADHPRSSTLSSYWISDSCNGLLLCCNSDDYYYSNFFSRNVFHPMPIVSSCCVYNPTTKSSAKIPPPAEYHWSNMFGLNLAFDPAMSHSYKIVCVRGAWDDKMVQIEIYSSETRAWRLSSCKQFSSNKVRFTNGVYWNGSIHWINYFSKEILRFNLDKEELGKVPLPSTLRGIDEIEKRVGYFGESSGHLHVVEICCGVLNIHELKNDYSEWLLRYRVDMTRSSNMINYKPRIFSLVRGDGEKCGSFLFFKAGGKVTLCNLDQNTFEEIFGMESMDYAFQYIESLVSV